MNGMNADEEDDGAIFISIRGSTFHTAVGSLLKQEAKPVSGVAISKKLLIFCEIPNYHLALAELSASSIN